MPSVKPADLHLLSYEQRLNLMLDDIFDVAYEQQVSLYGLSGRAGLAYDTVRRINDRLTKLPRLRTVMMLARAVGMELVFARTGRQKRKTA